MRAETPKSVTTGTTRATTESAQRADLNVGPWSYPELPGGRL